ncbi:hypothetical protein [Halorubrum depositum]|nr:hypothetical protein [Halorubrum depositum]
MASDTFMHRLSACHLLYTAKVVGDGAGDGSTTAGGADLPER